MKILLIILAILLSFSNPIYANSGPVYWEGQPSFQVLAIEKDNTISVESEKLIFDFTEAEHLNTIDYTRYGLVTAEYSMLNSSNNKRSVQMAFPFISSLRNFNMENIKITSDNQDIPYEILLGGNASPDNYNFDNIVSSINKGIYNPNSFNLDEIGTLYTYDISPTEDESIYIALKYDFDSENTMIIADGFNSYSWGQEIGYTMGTFLDGKTRVQIFVIGEEVEFDIKAYTDGANTKETENFAYNLEKEKTSLRNYLNDFIEEDENAKEYSGVLSENQLFNLYAKELDEVFTHNVKLIMLDDLVASDYWDRIFVILYNVDFEPNEEKDININYITKGTMDKRSTDKPMYRFEYILNPAGNWSSFKDLNIEIIPPKDYPFVVDSSITLDRNEEGIYTGFTKELPEKDFVFTLYSKEKVTLLDKVNGKLRYNSFIAYIVILIGVPLVRILYRFIKRMIKEKDDNYYEKD